MSWHRVATRSKPGWLFFDAFSFTPFIDGMGKNRQRRRAPVTAPTPFEEARDEMFQQIMRCGVIGADPEHQADWFDDTIRYLADRYHELTNAELNQLRQLGERFVQPPRAKESVESVAETV